MIVSDAVRTVARKVMDFLWPKERIVRRRGIIYHMGPDIVECVESTPWTCKYVTTEVTPEGWELEIYARRSDGMVGDKVGQQHGIRWGFVD